MEELRSAVEKLSPEQVAEYREAFNLYDVDTDGVIGLNELKETLTSLGQDPTDQEIKEMMEKVDLDGKCLTMRIIILAAQNIITGIKFWSGFRKGFLSLIIANIWQYFYHDFQIFSTTCLMLILINNFGFSTITLEEIEKLFSCM